MKELLEYFKGDELAANVFKSKYAQEGDLTPDDMHKRMAKEFARIEAKYPNPMSEEATVKIDQSVDLEGGKVSFLIYNIVGKEIFKISQIKNYEINISRDNFKTSGLYFYQLNIDEKLQSTGKVIVK